ncbi:MAG: hypothetical protein DI556_09755 [Rhodovulum sulfidophilum]|uniref:Uncharacterized protein n=1 Tax=Rhodovulum sulfidophilum TaxID=35806 RepID=A0A2W5N8D3_RHOSU|nr:MAG: hypothetical protein DI556_09755 [Rhodovulum sulfidophilum]
MLNFKKGLDAYAVGRRVNSEEWNSITLTAEAANDAARILFGAPVVAGVGRKTGAEASGGGQIFMGLAEADVSLPRPGDAYARYDEMAVCESGVIAVPVEGNTAKGAQARWNTATRKWTGAAQSATVLTIPGVVFEHTATAPGVIPVRVRKTVPSNTVAS